MDFEIRKVVEKDIDAVVKLSLRAWEPVFDSFANVLGETIFARLYPDWQAGQRKVVEEICRDEDKMQVYVADRAGQVAGFVAYEINKDATGEIQLLAVDPVYQNQGVGTALTNFALERLQEGGVLLAVVATGGDAGHAPARRTYEKAGFVGLPLVRYYKAL